MICTRKKSFIIKFYHHCFYSSGLFIPAKKGVTWDSLLLSLAFRLATFLGHLGITLGHRVYRGLLSRLLCLHLGLNSQTLSSEELSLLLLNGGIWVEL